MAARLNPGHSVATLVHVAPALLVVEIEPNDTSARVDIERSVRDVSTVQKDAVSVLCFLIASIRTDAPDSTARVGARSASLFKIDNHYVGTFLNLIYPHA